MREVDSVLEYMRDPIKYTGSQQGKALFGIL